MTGQQLLHDLRAELEATAEQLPADSPDRESRVRDLDDRALWSGRLRRAA